MLEPHDLQRLADELPSEFAALAYLGAMVGLRWSEAVGLRVGDLDLLRGALTVAEGLHEVAGHVVFEQPKSAMSRRTIALPAMLVDLLAAHLASRDVTGSLPDALLFVDRTGGPVRYSNFRSRVWLPATRRAGLDGFRFHDLRRTAATAMVQSGVDVKTAQARLGHADPRLTLEVYAQATTQADRAAAASLERHFRVSGAPPSSASTPGSA